MKKAKESEVIMSNLVLPGTTNGYGNLMGGQLVYWMDIAAGISAMKHCQEKCMTVSVDNLNFNSPIILNDIVYIQAKVTRCFNSSMEVYVKVYGEKIITNKRYLANEAYFTFVALNDYNRPVKIKDIEPESEEEVELYENALKRRELRLILAKKLDPNQSNYFKNFNSQG